MWRYFAALVAGFVLKGNVFVDAAGGAPVSFCASASNGNIFGGGNLFAFNDGDRYEQSHCFVNGNTLFDASTLLPSAPATGFVLRDSTVRYNAMLTIRGLAAVAAEADRHPLTVTVAGSQFALGSSLVFLDAFPPSSTILIFNTTFQGGSGPIASIYLGSSFVSFASLSAATVQQCAFGVAWFSTETNGEAVLGAGASLTFEKNVLEGQPLGSASTSFQCASNILLAPFGAALVQRPLAAVTVTRNTISAQGVFGRVCLDGGGTVMCQSLLYAPANRMRLTSGAVFQIANNHFFVQRADAINLHLSMVEHSSSSSPLVAAAGDETAVYVVENNFIITTAGTGLQLQSSVSLRKSENAAAVVSVARNNFTIMDGSSAFIAAAVANSFVVQESPSSSAVSANNNSTKMFVTISDNRVNAYGTDATLDIASVVVIGELSHIAVERNSLARMDSGSPQSAPFITFGLDHLRLFRSNVSIANNSASSSFLAASSEDDSPLFSGHFPGIAPQPNTTASLSTAIPPSAESFFFVCGNSARGSRLLTRPSIEKAIVHIPANYVWCREEASLADADDDGGNDGDESIVPADNHLGNTPVPKHKRSLEYLLFAAGLSQAVATVIVDGAAGPEFAAFAILLDSNCNAKSHRRYTDSAMNIAAPFKSLYASGEYWLSSEESNLTATPSVKNNEVEVERERLASSFAVTILGSVAAVVFILIVQLVVVTVQLSSTSVGPSWCFGSSKQHNSATHHRRNSDEVAASIDADDNRRDDGSKARGGSVASAAADANKNDKDAMVVKAACRATCCPAVSAVAASLLYGGVCHFTGKLINVLGADVSVGTGLPFLGLVAGCGFVVLAPIVFAVAVLRKVEEVDYKRYDRSNVSCALRWLVPNGVNREARRFGPTVSFVDSSEDSGWTSWALFPWLFCFVIAAFSHLPADWDCKKIHIGLVCFLSACLATLIYMRPHRSAAGVMFSGCSMVSVGMLSVSFLVKKSIAAKDFERLQFVAGCIIVITAFARFIHAGFLFLFEKRCVGHQSDFTREVEVSPSPARLGGAVVGGSPSPHSLRRRNRVPPPGAVVELDIADYNNGHQQIIVSTGGRGDASGGAVGFEARSPNGSLNNYYQHGGDGAHSPVYVGGASPLIGGSGLKNRRMNGGGSASRGRSEGMYNNNGSGGRGDGGASVNRKGSVVVVVHTTPQQQRNRQQPRCSAFEAAAGSAAEGCAPRVLFGDDGPRVEHNQLVQNHSSLQHQHELNAAGVFPDNDDDTSQAEMLRRMHLEHQKFDHVFNKNKFFGSKSPQSYAADPNAEVIKANSASQPLMSQPRCSVVSVVGRSAPRQNSTHAASAVADVVAGSDPYRSGSCASCGQISRVASNAAAAISRSNSTATEHQQSQPPPLPMAGCGAYCDSCNSTTSTNPLAANSRRTSCASMASADALVSRVASLIHQRNLQEAVEKEGEEGGEQPFTSSSSALATNRNRASLGGNTATSRVARDVVHEEGYVAGGRVFRSNSATEATSTAAAASPHGNIGNLDILDRLRLQQQQANNDDGGGFGDYSPPRRINTYGHKSSESSPNGNVKRQSVAAAFSALSGSPLRTQSLIVAASSPNHQQMMAGGFGGPGSIHGSPNLKFMKSD